MGKETDSPSFLFSSSERDDRMYGGFPGGTFWRKLVFDHRWFTPVYAVLFDII